jgi:hypothetical protein
MPGYDASDFRPPAPLALVTIRSSASGKSTDNVPMLIDTGADVSLVPRAYVADLTELTDSATQYELEGFGGTRSLAPAVRVELHFLGKVFRGQFLLVEGRHGVLGRNVLNLLSLHLNGPALTWRELR